jgi:hypothetical protein
MLYVVYNVCIVNTLFSCIFISFRWVDQMVAFQKKFIYTRLMSQSQSHIIYTGLKKRYSSALEIPGVVTSGWLIQQQAMRGSERDRNLVQSKLNNSLKHMLDKIKAQECCWPFQLPVKKSEVRSVL